MLAKVQIWGNSLALRIPKSFAGELRLGPGSPVNLTVKDGKLLIEPADGSEYRLDDLLSQVNEANIHYETDCGGRAGKEQW